MAGSDKRPELILGNQDADFLRIEVVDYAFPQAQNPWSANWLKCDIAIKAGSFGGKYMANIRNIDFRTFKDELKFLRDKPDGKAIFNSFEEYLEVRIEGNGLGDYIALCRAKDKFSAYGNRLMFLLKFQKSDIPTLAGMIDDILKRFPLREIDGC